MQLKVGAKSNTGNASPTGDRFANTETTLKKVQTDHKQNWIGAQDQAIEAASVTINENMNMNT